MKKIFFISWLIAGVITGIDAKPKSEIKHTVKKGETLYSISKSYGLKPADLVKANPQLGAKASIKPGQKLNVPAKANIITPASNMHNTVIAHKVVNVPSTPDTPYREEDSRRANKISETEIASASVNTEPPVIEKAKAVHENNPAVSLRTNSANSGEYGVIFSQYYSHGFKARTNRGAANYLPDNTAGNPYLALYSDAASGSIIKVTNMMNKRSVYVKVVGRVPANDAGSEVILKLSNKAAQELGVIDSKFLVEVTGFAEN
jgi:LysM repeat protein